MICLRKKSSHFPYGDVEGQTGAFMDALVTAIIVRQEDMYKSSAVNVMLSVLCSKDETGISSPFSVAHFS